MVTFESQVEAGTVSLARNSGPQHSTPRACRRWPLQHRCFSRCCLPLGAAEGMNHDDSYRLTQCNRCRRHIRSCSHCDRGQEHCSDTCRSEARRESLRHARAIYQRTPQGEGVPPPASGRLSTPPARKRDGSWFTSSPLFWHPGTHRLGPAGHGERHTQNRRLHSPRRTGQLRLLRPPLRSYGA